MMKNPFLANKPTRLFIVSLFILYFELVAIRYIPAQIRYVGFFSNMILLASFAGIGLGSIFYKQLQKIPIYILPMIVWAFQLIINFFQYDLVVASEEVIYFNGGFGSLNSDPALLIPVIFVLVVLVFLIPAGMMGRLFSQFKPLTAYTLNILGSIAGVLLFVLGSYLQTDPVIWFSLLILLLIPLIPRLPSTNWLLGYLVLFVVFVNLERQNLNSRILNSSQHQHVETQWSPYYKITIYRILADIQQGVETLHMMVNNINHQHIVDPSQTHANSPYPYNYQQPYELFPDRKFDHALIIGSGAGNDVAKALQENVRQVTAVEIDPVIVEFGKKYHPNQPYQADQVTTIINDGRAYLVNTDQKFDLIIYALTDSLTLTAGTSNLRLESYLFTQEALQDAYRILTDDGLFVMYNDYRRDWIVDKVYQSLAEVFQTQPYVIKQANGKAAVIASKQSLDLPIEPYQPESSQITLPTDDWPFLYMKQAGIPQIYRGYLLLIALVVLIGLPYLYKHTQGKFDLALFFTGAAFMLLETKNIVQFSLLFGSTWLTNAVVFIGILMLVLAAVWSTDRLKHIRLSWLYVGLFISILFVYVFPQRQLLYLDFYPRLLAAIVINFAPIYLANLIFARLFKSTKTAPIALGANLLGAFVGGIFEYSALIWGYRNLMIFVALFYVLSFYYAKNRQ